MSAPATRCRAAPKGQAHERMRPEAVSRGRWPAQVTRPGRCMRKRSKKGERLLMSENLEEEKPMAAGGPPGTGRRAQLDVGNAQKPSPKPVSGRPPRPIECDGLSPGQNPRGGRVRVKDTWAERRGNTPQLDARTNAAKGVTPGTPSGPGPVPARPCPSRPAVAAHFDGSFNGRSRDSRCGSGARPAFVGKIPAGMWCGRLTCMLVSVKPHG